MTTRSIVLTTKVLLLAMLPFMTSSCFLFGNDAEPACRPCYATLPNGEVMTVETCSAEEEQSFMVEYRDFNPSCR